MKGSAYPAPTSSGAAVPRGLGVLRATASLEETPVEEKEEEPPLKQESRVATSSRTEVGQGRRGTTDEMGEGGFPDKLQLNEKY